MTKKQERHIIATVGTVLFLLLVFLILWFCYLTAVAPEQEKGVEVEFAEIEEVEEPEEEPSASAYAEEPSEAAPAAPASPAPEIATDPKPASPPEPILSEEETLALERARKEKEESEAAEKARKKKEAEAIAKANQFSNLFGKTDGTSVGGEQNAGLTGNPLGGKTSGPGRDGRISGLKGRQPRDGRLPEPTCDFDHYGVVVVQIKIDKDGNNIYAVNASGTNTSDKEMIQCAINAIKKTKWTAGDGEAMGTITYTFNVK